MTRKLYSLATRLQAKLLEAGLAHMDNADRDAWATLFRWHQAGERVWRVKGPSAALLPGLDLARAPTIASAVLYQLDDRSEWILVARHGAAEAIAVKAPDMVFAYPEPMLTYLTPVADTLASGVVNLQEMPTPADLWLPAGRQGQRWLDQDDVSTEETRLRRVLPYFYGST